MGRQRVGIQAIAGHAVDVPDAGAQRSAPLTDRFSHRSLARALARFCVGHKPRAYPALAGYFLL